MPLQCWGFLKIFLEDMNYNDLLEVLKICPQLNLIYTDSELTFNLAKQFGLTEEEFCEKFLNETGVKISRFGY